MSEESRRDLRRSLIIRMLWYVGMLVLPALALFWVHPHAERWIWFGWLVGVLVAFSSPLSRGGAWVATALLTVLAVVLRWVLVGGVVVLASTTSPLPAATWTVALGPDAILDGEVAVRGERTLHDGSRLVPLHLVTIDPRQAVIAVIDVPKPDSDLVAVAGPSAIAGITGGYFDRPFDAVGLLISEGIERHAFAADGPSGVFAVTPDGQVSIVPSASWSAAGETPMQALQAGPLLVDPGGKIGIRSGDDVPQARCCLAIGDDGGLRLIATGALTLRELAEVLVDRRLVGFTCERALNCDGGPSAMWFAKAGEVLDLDAASGPVRSLVVVRRR